MASAQGPVVDGCSCCTCSCCCPGPHTLTCLVLGGVGTQALRLGLSLQQALAQHPPPCSPTASSPCRPLPAIHVLSSHADVLTQSLAEQLVAHNTQAGVLGHPLPQPSAPTNAPAALPDLGLGAAASGQSNQAPGTCIPSGRVLIHTGPSLPEWVRQEVLGGGRSSHGKAAVQAHPCTQAPRAPLLSGPAAARAALLVCPAAASARPALRALCRLLSEALPFLAQGAHVAPAALRFRAALLEGAQVLDQNRVDVEAMEADTGGD